MPQPVVEKEGGREADRGGLSETESQEKQIGERKRILQIRSGLVRDHQCIHNRLFPTPVDIPFVKPNIMYYWEQCSKQV